jgi:hypothetical protein
VMSNLCQYCIDFVGLFWGEKARFPPLMEKSGYEAELGKGGNLFSPRGSNGVGKGSLSLSLSLSQRKS